jgi:hypothetical protein
MEHTPLDTGIVDCTYVFDLNRSIKSKMDYNFLGHATIAFSQRFEDET